MGETGTMIRTMREGDVDWVAGLGNITSEIRTGTSAAQFFGKDTLRSWVNNPDGVTLVAEVGGKPAGFLLGYYMAGPNDGYISDTIVSPEHRRKGVGRALQEAALDEFEQKGPEGNKCDHVFSVVAEGNMPMLSLKKEVGFDIGRKFHYVDIMLPRLKK